MAGNFEHRDLTLQGRYTHDGDYYTLYVLLNGVELPVQRLSVADYRELFEQSRQPQASEQTSE